MSKAGVWLMAVKGFVGSRAAFVHATKRWAVRLKPALARQGQSVFAI